MSHLNNNIPKDYQPTPDAIQPPTFSAPAHNFNSRQAEEIVKLAESSHNDTGSMTTGSTAGSGLGQSGYGSSGNTGLSGSSGLGSGAGVGSGIGSGSTGYTGGERGLPPQSGDYQLGRNDNDSRVGGHGLAAGAGAAGLGAGAAGYGASQHSGRGEGGFASSETPRESSGEKTSDGRIDTTPNQGSGPVASHGTLEHSLQSELERNARKKGTHAAGFGTAGMSSDTGMLHHESTGITGAGQAGGYSQGNSGSSGLTSGLTGSSSGMQQPLGGQSGYGQGQDYPIGGQSSGRQGLENKLVGEVENRAHGAGSSNVTGLGSAAANNSTLGSSTGRAL